MIRQAREDGVRTVELLQRHNEREFVLEGHRAERPKQIRSLAYAGMMAVRSADQNRTRLARMEGDFFHLGGKSPAGKHLAALIEDKPETILAQRQQPLAFACGIGSLHVLDLHERVIFQPPEVFVRPVPGVRKPGFADKDEAPAQGGIRRRAVPD